MLVTNVLFYTLTYTFLLSANTCAIRLITNEKKLFCNSPYQTALTKQVLIRKCRVLDIIFVNMIHDQKRLTIL